MSWSLRVRGGSGQAVLSSLLPGTPLTELQELIAEKLGIPAQQQELLAGFPPQSIQVRPRRLPLVMPCLRAR